MASAEEIASLIRKSELNTEDLVTLHEALRIKQRAVARLMVRTLKKGDRVRITSIKPRYLEGLTATVIAPKETKIEILIDEQFDTGRYGHKIICPAACLAVI